jgi:ferrochelatase
MAHGTPATFEGIEPFYTRIRRGNPPSPEQLADLQHRYEAIGGVSPLAARTAAQVSGLAALLEAEQPGRHLVVFGAKHTDPSIEEAAGTLAASGVAKVVGLVLTPHRSSMGSGEYLARAAGALADSPAAPPFTPVEQWWGVPGFAELVADHLSDALSDLPSGARPAVLFTAHSLPQRVVNEGDPYAEQVTASAAAVVAALDDHDVPWQVAWQSAGRTPEPWIGPDVISVIYELKDRGFDAVVLCPIGFVSDHLEVLYDLDVEARAAAEKAGLIYVRTASLNDDAAFLSLLAGVVRTASGNG